MYFGLSFLRNPIQLAIHPHAYALQSSTSTPGVPVHCHSGSKQLHKKGDEVETEPITYAHLLKGIGFAPKKVSAPLDGCSAIYRPLSRCDVAPLAKVPINRGKKQENL